MTYDRRSSIFQLWLGRTVRCAICEKVISQNSLAKATHGKAHVRDGTAEPLIRGSRETGNRRVDYVKVEG